MFVCIRVCVCARHISGEWHFSFCSSLMASLAGLLRWKPRCHGNAACLCELEVFHSLSPPLSLTFCHTLPRCPLSLSPVPLSLSVSSSLILLSTCLPPKNPTGQQLTPEERCACTWKSEGQTDKGERGRGREWERKKEEWEWNFLCAVKTREGKAKLRDTWRAAMELFGDGTEENLSGANVKIKEHGAVRQIEPLNG